MANVKASPSTSLPDSCNDVEPSSNSVRLWPLALGARSVSLTVMVKSSLSPALAVSRHVVMTPVKSTGTAGGESG